MGEIAAVVSLKLGEWLLCLKGAQACHDYATDLSLIVTIPVHSFLGSIFILLFTWANLRISSESVWTSVFSYSDSRRALNWARVILIQLVLWPLLTVGAFRLTWK